MKYHKAYGASTAARIMSSQEIDQLVAQSLKSKHIPSANTPVAPADIAKSKPIVKPVAKPVVKPMVKSVTMPVTKQRAPECLRTIVRIAMILEYGSKDME